MRFLADENINDVIVGILRKNGYNVLHIAELAPSISDEEVIEIANHESALIITADKHFGELIFNFGLPAYGVIFVRLRKLPFDEIANRISSVILGYSDRLKNSFTVITHDSVRIRKM
jgi:predicted nuclease of predicted toxin-antitoxin system